MTQTMCKIINANEIERRDAVKLKLKAILVEKNLQRSFGAKRAEGKTTIIQKPWGRYCTTIEVGRT